MSFPNTLTESSNLVFTLEEEEKFTTRYQNGYDLRHDVQYNEWLKRRHPETLYSRPDQAQNVSPLSDNSICLNFEYSEQEPTEGIYIYMYV